MATRRSNFMNPNLGSGARATAGGTYENPRLGIEDYTAFGRGVGSTLRAPEQKEVQQLEGGIDYFGADQDDILGGLEFKENTSLVKSFTDGPLAQMQAQYAKCSRANDRRCLQNITNDLGLYQAGQNNFRNLIENYADGEVYDSETSKGRFLIDVNGNQIKKPDGSFVTIADLTKVNNDNPKDMNIGIALDKNGDKKAVYQFKMDGQTYTTNLSDLTDNYLKSSFDVRSNIGINVQTAMNKGGATFGYKDEPRMFTSETKETTEDGISITKLKGFEGIVDTQTPGGDGLGYFTNADNAAELFAGDLYKTSSSPGNNSSFHALAKRLYNNDFTSVVDGYNRPTTKNETDFINELKALPNDVKLAMLQDEGAEEWKIKNASKGHKRGDDGRAERLDKNYLVKTSRVEKPIDEGDGSGSGFNPVTYSNDFYSSLNRAIVDDVGGKLRPGQQQPFEDFLQTYNVPVETISDIQYIPSKTGGPDAGLGILTIDWAREGFNDDGKKIVGAQSTPYDLKTKDGIRKLVNHMSAFSPSLKGSGQGDKSRRQTLIDEFDRVKDIIKFGAISEFKNTNPVVQN
jgi:hypothetical protein